MSPWIERVLLRVLPASFRERFGDDLRDEWRQLRQQARTRHGRLAEWGYVIRESRSFVRLVRELRARESHKSRQVTAGSAWRHVWPDVRGAWRQTARRPAVALAMILTLTLALAAAAVAFGVARGVLWRALPFPDESRLVLVWERITDPARVTGSRFLDWRARSSSFASMSAFGAALFHVEGPEGVTNVGGVRVSWNFLDTLGVAPALGRGFNAADQAQGAPRVVLLSHAYWQQRMGGRPDVIGQPLRMGGNPYTIIGVLPAIWMPAWPVNPASVTLDPDSRQLWVPLAPEATMARNGTSHVLGVVARLRDGQTIAQAEQELQSTAATDLDRHGAVVRPFRAQMTGQARGPLVTLLGAAFCVWLVACLNLAALQLAAFESRRAEFATRVALGAVPGRLVRQLWIESAWIVGIASAAALAVAQGGFVLLPARLSAHVPFVALPTVDANLVVFVTALAGVTVAAFTAWPMRRLRRLKGPAQPRTVAANPRVFRTLVVAQLAGTVALVAVSALLLRSFWSLQRRDAGFDVTNVLAVDIGLPTGSRFNQPESASAYETALRHEVSGRPWATGSAFAYDHPLEANWLERVTVVGGPQDRDGDAVAQSQLRIVSPTYFRTLDVRVVDGRAFEEHEGLGAEGVVMVNEAFMRRTPLTLGRRLRVAAPQANWGDAAPNEFTIVGVVEDERFRGLEADVEPAVYISTRQFPLSHLVLLVRTSGAGDFGADLRAAVRRVDPGASLTSVSTLQSKLADQQLTRTLTTDLVGGFAALSLLLASVGLHGLLTLIVTARRREIGIRLALGASRQSVAAMVIRESVRPTLLGLLVGLLLAQLAGGSIRALLVDVTALDPFVLGGVAAFMLMVGVVAAALPARHATSVDPANTLRD